jgi:hypothetical protein
MAQMAEQRTICLAHSYPKLLSLRVIGFTEINNDQAILLPGHYPMAACIRNVCQKIESEPKLRILGAIGEWEAKPDQRIEQAMLREFELAPARKVVAKRKVGDRSVMSAGRAKGFGRIGRNQPVAGIIPGVGAEAIAAIGPGKRAPHRPVLLDRGKLTGRRQVTKPVEAVLTLEIFKIEQLRAVLTQE